MKRTIILLTFIFAASVSFAQKGKVTSAQNFKDSGNLEKALEAIKETIDPSNDKSEKTIDWPKTWEVRGEIYQAIYQSEDENVKKLAENPLATAFESYKKALELDEKGRFSNGLKIKLTLLTNDLTNQAVEGFNSEDYEKALNAFEQILAINSMPLIKGDNPETIDTVIVYNTGLAAYNAQQYDKAIKYYKEAAEYGYNGARTYSLIASAYQMKKDTLGALEILQEGFEKYPDDNNVLTSMIQIYLDQDKTEDAMKYLEMAIEQDPDNATFYFAQGTLFEKLENDEKAIESYEKAIEVDPENYGAYYNLGALYYNKGVQQIEVANSVPANENERYLEETKKADVWWEKALPYMEKCNELKPDDLMTLESLKNLYYRMKQMDKYNEMLEKLGQ
ncbi:tetratricopeptide repeat protein [Maribellus maritimus]|uniref:tetratricopeptide repeat protein n=1 Tax=Maribellus maritimus TaxID=2870838 RepID=UPI001EEC5384|nr:tetratricopeptide repeat protein [Maribellus maritimus]MCG6188005.1 tetratricopeptide repeat protein [Maribellus maritimus]